MRYRCTNTRLITEKSLLYQTLCASRIVPVYDEDPLVSGLHQGLETKVEPVCRAWILFYGRNLNIQMRLGA
jgi:hypothetical protein